MILLLLANGFHENELTEQIPVLRTSGCDIRTASLSDLSVTSASGRVFDCEYTLENFPEDNIDLLILSDTAQNLSAALLLAQGVRMNGGRVSFFHTKYRFDEEKYTEAQKVASEEVETDKGAYEEALSVNEPDTEAHSEETPTEDVPAEEAEETSFVSETVKESDETPENECEEDALENSEETSEELLTEESETEAEVEAEAEKESETEADDDSEKETEKAPEEESEQEEVYHHVSPTVFPSRPLPDPHILTRHAHPKPVHSVYEQQVGDSLVGFLKNFGIESKLSSIGHSARYTVYTLAPRSGTSQDVLDKAIGQTEEVLAEEGIRLMRSVKDPFLLDFEMKNSDASPLTLGDMIERKKTGGLPASVLPLGETPSGESAFISPDSLGNMLISGEEPDSDGDPSLSLLTSILFSQKPSDAACLVIDTETNRFVPFNDLPHLLMPALPSESSALAGLLWLKEEFEMRSDLLALRECETLTACRESIRAEDPSFSLPEIYVFLRGIEDLTEYRDDIFELLSEMMPSSDKVGIHFILSLRKIAEPALPAAIPEACSTRLCFRVPNVEDSLVILFREGAEKLSEEREALLLHNERLFRIECPSVSEQDTEKVIAAIRALYPMEKQDPALAESADTLLNAFLHPAETEEPKQETEPEEKTVEKENCEEDAPFEEEVIEEIPESSPEEEMVSEEENIPDEDMAEELQTDVPAVQLKDLLGNQSFLAAARASLKLGKISVNRLVLLFDFQSEEAEQILDMLEYLGLVSEADEKGERITKMTEAEWTTLLKESTQN